MGAQSNSNEPRAEHLLGLLSTGKKDMGDLATRVRIIQSHLALSPKSAVGSSSPPTQEGQQRNSGGLLSPAQLAESVPLETLLQAVQYQVETKSDAMQALKESS